MSNARKQSTPLISVIVSTYESSRFIRGCLESLVAQSIRSELEVIVVVSGSPENEWEIAREFESRFENLVLLRTGNREGLYTAWNRAIHLARGEFITNANTDDRLHPQALEKLSNVLLSDEKLGLVYGDCIQTEKENETFETTAATELLENQDYSYYDLHRHCFIGPCPMWRRSVHEEVGYFDDEKYWSAADYDFWLRMGAHYPMMHLRDKVGLFQNRESSLAHLQIGKDESDEIMRYYRQNADMNALFPGLQAECSPENQAVACAAMADICLEGPWQVDLGLAQKYLNLAAELHPTMQVDINRAVIIAMTGNLAEAKRLLSLHSGDPTTLHNIRWIDSIQSNQQTTSPIMIRTRHPFVIEARKLHGINPQEILPKPPMLPPPDDPHLLQAAMAEHFIANQQTHSNESPARHSVLITGNSRSLNPEAPEVSASIALIQLARNLAKRGHEVTVAAPLKCDGGERNGVDYRNLDSSTELDTDLKELFRRFDTLIVTDDAAMMTRSLRFRNLKKRILWLQSMESTAPVVSVCELNRSADSILCVSDLQKSRLEKAGISPSKLRVIRYGTDPSVYYSRPVHRDHCRICYNGSSSSMSGVDVLLAAFMIVKQCLPHAVLDIFGETIQATDLIDICLWKGKGVNFHEKVSENRLAEAYSRSSLFVIPTRIEQGTVCGLNSLNAQACACPVLTTACAGAKDTIVDGITGRLLSQDSAEALATAMIQMLLDPLRLRIMGETGRAHVLQSFLWEHMADEFLDLIGNVEANEAKFSLPHLNAPIKLGDPAITSQELELMRSVRFHSKVIS